MEGLTPILLVPVLAACLATGLVGIRMLRPSPAERVFGPPAEETPRAGRSGVRILDALAERLGPRVMAWFPETQRRNAQRRLEIAGRPDGMTLHDYFGQRAAAALLFGSVGLVFWLVIGSWRWGVGLLVLGLVSVDAQLLTTARKRQGRIDRELPDFLDLLSISLSAGSSFRSALQQVTDATDGPLGEELTTALRQIEVGASRREAFRDLRERNDSKVLGKFVSALLQAEELGTPLSDVLARLAADLRKAAGQRVRADASRIEASVLLVVVLLVMPAAALLIVGGFALSFDWSTFDLFNGGQVLEGLQ